MNNYLEFLKEAAAPKAQNRTRVEVVNMNTVSTEMSDDLYELWKMSIDENNKMSKRYKEKPLPKNDYGWRNFIYYTKVVAFIQDDKPLGMLGLVDKPDRVLMIYDFIVNPKFRGRGVGSELMKTAAQLAKKWGYKKLELDVWDNNLIAKKMYTKHGFRNIHNRMRKHL